MKTPNAKLSMELLVITDRAVEVAIEDLKNDMILHDHGTIEDLRMLRANLNGLIVRLKLDGYDKISE